MVFNFSYCYTTQQGKILWYFALFWIVVGIVGVLPVETFATEYSSDNFTVRDPVIQSGADRATSTTFELFENVGQIAIGESNSTTFGLHSGFLYFPSVTAPIPTATAGDGSVTLSWTAAAANLGFTIGGYNIGQATVSGGPYTYTSVGSVTESEVSGLSNGTTYYFVLRPEDAFGNTIATSTEVSATPEASETEDAPPPAQPSGVAHGIIRSLLDQFGFPSRIPAPEEIPDEDILERCGSDLNCDGVVDIEDLSIYLYFEKQPTPNPADLNNDNQVAVSDLSVLLYDWSRSNFRLIPDDTPYDFFSREDEQLFEDRDSQFAAIGDFDEESPDDTVSPPLQEVDEDAETETKNVISRAVSAITNTIKNAVQFVESLIDRAISSF